VTSESETSSKEGEEVPVTIDSLRMELTSIKTNISFFDKHLREFAKTGACSKKIQDELTKYKNENAKLREEVKRSKEDAEKFEKVMKYVNTLDK
jgi:predicted RNase H-like nuclease (RuvC/YqgF family)